MQRQQGRSVDQMEEIVGRPPRAPLAVQGKEIRAGEHEERVREFVRGLAPLNTVG